MHRFAHRISVIPMFFAVLAAAACGDNGTEPETELTGDFALTTVDGDTLPFVVFELGDDKLEVTAGQIAFAAAGTFVWTLDLRETISGEASSSTETATGTFARSDDEVTLTVAGDDDSPYSAALSGDVLTFTQGGIVFRFERETP